MTPEDIEQFANYIGMRTYQPAKLPSDLQRGPVGQCFDWCIVQAINNPKYTYVEGIARIKRAGRKHTDWILHAWLTDSAGDLAFDPTWGTLDNKTGQFNVAPAEYMGLAMPTRSVAKFMRATGYQGVLANRHRAPKIMNEILEANHVNT